MLRLTIFFAWSLLAIAPLRADDPLQKYRATAVEKWSKELERIEVLDEKEADPADAVLFIGSSSIRLWNDIAADMKPWPVVQRGYGGAKFSDLAVLAEQIIKPHKYRALAIYVGNDVTGGTDDKTPEEVVRLFEHVVATSRRHAPQAPIFLIEITPTPRRWAAQEKITETNAALKKACQLGENLHFISTADQYLTADGQPMPALFKEDKLHQNRDGYTRWSRIIRQEFSRVIPVKSGER